MADRSRERLSIPELDPYIVTNVVPTGRELGRGAYGSVEEVEIPGVVCAAKRLHEQLIQFGSAVQVREWVTSFVRECRLASLLRHPHVVQFLGVCYLPGSHLPVLLMEKLMTSLDDLLEKNKNIPLDIKVSILIDISRGLVYLHCRDPPIIHRDLSARNILLTPDLTAKIADLGVARMVVIQPGKIAATMTRNPGNVIYMPPEVAGNESTKYNTAIDMFSFGVVALFTLTQVFPDELQASNYFNPTTRQLVARTEIERRIEYIQLLNKGFGETHPLVQLVVNCLNYLPEDRPSAVVTLERLKTIQSQVPQEWDMNKLELIHHIQCASRKDKVERTEHETQLSEKQVQIDEKQRQIEQLQGELTEKQKQVDQLHGNTLQLQQQISQIQRRFSENQQQIVQFRKELSQKQEQIGQLQAGIFENRQQSLSELDLTHKQQLTLHKAKSENAESAQLQMEESCSPATNVPFEEKPGKCQEVKPKAEGQGQKPKLKKERPAKKLKQNKVKKEDSKPKDTTPDIPNSITFNWRLRNPLLRMSECFHDKSQSLQRPVVVNGKVYMRGGFEGNEVWEYTPENDHCQKLKSGFGRHFTLLNVDNRLFLIAGHSDVGLISTIKLWVWNSVSQEWNDPYADCSLSHQHLPAVIAYRDYLIFSGGYASTSTRGKVFKSDVIIFDINGHRWYSGTPLPAVDYYSPIIVDDNLYLIGCERGVVLQAHLSTPIGSSLTWKQLADAPVPNHSSIIANDNMILTFGDGVVHHFKPHANQWTKIGDFLTDCYSCTLLPSGELLAIGKHYVKISALNIEFVAPRKSLWTFRSRQ